MRITLRIMREKRRRAPRRKLHQDWRVWAALGLMLAAMGMYIFSLDDAVQPGSAANDNVPAASSTANPPK